MTLRVLHIGNIANNAYNIAKALRERTDIEADVFTNSYCRYISQPEWEDVEFDPVQYDDFTVPDWGSVDLKGFKRPDWYFENLDPKVWDRLGNFDNKAMLRTAENLFETASFLKGAKKIKSIFDKKRLTKGGLRKCSSFYESLFVDPYHSVNDDYMLYLKAAYEKFFSGILTALTMDELKDGAKQSTLRGHQKLFSKYDIIQAYGVWEPMHPLLVTPSVPFVTFEHGSMREHPFMPETVGRLLALAYKKSFKNIITNGDSIHAIKRLGLDNYVFIPHPVDDTKFCPQKTDFRDKLLGEYGCSYILFAPARQNWRYKGNDKIFRAYSKLVKYFGKGSVKLLVSDWGQEVEKSKQMVRDIGIERDVVWLPPLCKPRLAKYYNASDLVLDQFMLGAFGTTTPEAMACGKPVVSFYKPEDHQWCFEDHPPIINAYSSDDIYESIERGLKDPEKLHSIGVKSLEWYKENHSLDKVVSGHVKIYEEIKSSPSTVTVPFEYKEKYLLRKHKQMKEVIAVIKCKSPSLIVKGKPQYLREVCGKPLIQIMADRLASIPIKKVILITNEEEPETIGHAKGLGWKVVIYNKHRPGDIIPGLQVLSHKYITIFDLNHPFIDKPLVSRMIMNMLDNDLDYCCLASNTCYGPQFIVKRHVLIKAGLFKMVVVRNRASWQDAFQNILGFVSRGTFSDTGNLAKTDLTAANASSSYVDYLGGVDFALDSLRALENDPELQIKLLHKEMLESDTPHVENKLLNEFELKGGKEKLLSFPTFVGLNMTSVCNAKCVFCSYSPKTQKLRDVITLEDLKKMTWLKYVSKIAVWGGIGDSLTNPEFLDCYRYLKETFPHLEVSFSTNGIKMNKGVCREFVGHLSEYNVSLNAAKKDTWEKLMQSKGFDNILETFDYMSEQKKEQGLEKPFMSVSMVLTRDNLNEAVDFVKLAHKIGAQRVTFVHYVSSTLVGVRQLEESASPYFMKDECDRVMEEASECAKSLGIQIVKPLPFSENNFSIVYGQRMESKPSECYDPWKTCYLTVDEDGNRQMIFCCSGFYYNIKYDKSNLNEQSFTERIWNHPMARYFRKTANVKGKNPICNFCMSYDRFDSQNNEKVYAIGRKIIPLMEKVDGDKISFDTEKITQEVDDIFEISH